MTDGEFKSYIEDRYQDQVKWYDRKAGVNQAIYNRMQWTIIILAAVTPVLVVFVLDNDLPAGLNHLPAVTSAAVAILTAAMKTFKYQETWINYRTTCESLRKEKHFLDANLGDYHGGSDDDRRATFVERVDSLISRENTVWQTTQKTGRRAKPEESPPDGNGVEG